MEHSFFTKVKEAIASDPKGILSQLGVKFSSKSESSKEWMSGLCPCGIDTSGSAGYTREGFMSCRQCSKKQDIFDWMAERDHTSPWEVCKQIADLLHVDVTARKRNQPVMPRAMTPDILKSAIYNLLETDQAASARKFLESRNLFHPQLLERFGVGWLAGRIIFAQFTATGDLRPSFRTYLPGGLARKWGWSLGKGGKQGFWPYFELPADGTILLLEGEFDVATAWSVSSLQELGYFAATWTGGAGTPIPAALIPEAWHGHRIEICYDNDVFQGPVWHEHRAPSPRKMEEMAMRRKNLLSGIAEKFAAVKCDVYVRAVPINPLENFGADFRDWIDQKGTLPELPIWPWEEVKPVRQAPKQVSFLDVFSQENGRRVTSRMEVGAIDAAGKPIPRHSLLICDRGNRPDCARCGGPDLCKDGMIHWDEMPRELATALAQDKPEAYILKNVVGKPASCLKAEIQHDTSVMGAKWWGIHDDEDESNMRELLVFTPELPTLSGEVEVEGRVWLAGTQSVLMAESMLQIDKEVIDMRPFLTDLHSMTKGIDSVEAIDQYLRARTADLSANVTRIYGRHDVHVAHDLLAHSALGFTFEDQLIRGWVDASVIGPTRTGKSLTFKRLMGYHGLGTAHTCMENISRAGLTMGATKDGRLRPGLFPRSHRKMLLLDEFHIMVQRLGQENPMNHLQSARDEGWVHGVKIYGARKLAAKVRFCGIGNWAKGRKNAFRFACEHFLFLYGRSEAVSRLDFGLAVSDDVEDHDIGEDITNNWYSELVRALILRAWAQEPEQIYIDQDARALAKQICNEWRSLYSSDLLPLFTPEEKIYSIIRLAISVANICFSHPDNDLSSVVVRKFHVQWAANWLLYTWVCNEYQDYSLTMMTRHQVGKPFAAELHLSVRMGLEDPGEAVNILPTLFRGVSIPDLCALLGQEAYEASKWVSTAVRNNLLIQDDDVTRQSKYILTQGGNQLVRNLLFCADEFPGEYCNRFEKLKRWGITDQKSQPGVLPLDLPSGQLRKAWEKDGPDRETNVVSGPGAG